LSEGPRRFRLEGARVGGFLEHRVDFGVGVADGGGFGGSIVFEDGFGAVLEDRLDVLSLVFRVNPLDDKVFYTGRREKVSKRVRKERKEELANPIQASYFRR
jgi:hypothetical protein